MTALRETPAFYPTLFGLSGLLLAGVVAWEGWSGVDRFLARGFWRDVSSAEAGQAIFPTVAAACITVAGVVFSITVVGLSQVSAQFGPRLLGSFMRATGTQVVLGVLLGTFVYLLAVIGRLGVTDDEITGPRLAVLLGLVLAIASFSSLIFFFHHLTRFLQVPRLLDQVTVDMLTTLDRVFPAQGTRPPCGEEERVGVGGTEGTAYPVLCPETGYVQLVDEKAALALAEMHDCVISVRVRPGDFVHEGDEMLHVGAAREPDGAFLAELRHLLRIGRERTRTQDPEFAFDQVSDMALRALSPSVNDPGTAVRCVDRLSVGLLRLASRRAPPLAVCADDGRPVLELRRHDHAGLVKAAYAPLRQSAAGHLAVLVRLLEATEVLARVAMPDAMRERLAAEAGAVLSLADEAAQSPTDAEDVNERRKRVTAAFAEHGLQVD